MGHASCLTAWRMPKDGEQRPGWFCRGMGVDSKWVAFPVSVNTKAQSLSTFNCSLVEVSNQKRVGLSFFLPVLHDKD